MLIAWTMVALLGEHLKRSNKLKEGIYIDPVSMDLAILYKSQMYDFYERDFYHYAFEGGVDSLGAANWRYGIPENYDQEILTKQGWHWCCYE